MVALQDFSLKDHYWKVRSGNLIYSFHGVVSTGIYDSIYLNLEEALNEKTVNRILKKKIFNVMVELVQNIYNYTLTLSNDFKEAIILVQKTEDGFEMVTGNYLEKNMIMTLESRAKIVNYLTYGELEDLYRGILKTGVFSDKNGAGLGLIDIAKKSKNNISYEFHSVNEKFSFLTIKALVKNS